MNENLTIVLGSFTNTNGDFNEIIQTHEGYFLSHNGVVNPANKFEDPVKFLCQVIDGYVWCLNRLKDHVSGRVSLNF